MKEFSMQSPCPVKAALILLPILAIFLTSSLLRSDTPQTAQKQTPQMIAQQR